MNTVTTQPHRTAPVHEGLVRSERIVLIPAFNEEAQISEVLRQTTEMGLGFQIVVVDDGSSDRTALLARRHGACVIQHPFNLGYGAALQTGYKYALGCGATLVVQMDADGQHDPRDIPTLIQPVLDGNADLVVGSRFLGGDRYRMGFAKNLGRSLLRTVALGFDLRITDPTSGFQAMNREVLGIYEGDFFPSDYPDLDVLLAAKRAGVRIEERRVSMMPSSRPSSIHRRLHSMYYLYKMFLSIWAGTAGYSGGRSLLSRTRKEVH